MLSIIICHRNEALLAAIKVNIESTIGIPYELIVIDNRNAEYSIFSAYNEGVRRAKFEIICFTHEDILFHTPNWGDKVLNHFKDSEVGMIGVAGGMAQSHVPSAWWFNNYFNNSARNILMSETSKLQTSLYQYYSNPFNNKVRAEVIIIDGMWFCIRKELFKSISFDEKEFKGYHIYDADISMQVLQYAKNFVVFDILVQHLWSYRISKDFYNSLCRFVLKWRDHLPIQAANVEEGYMNKYNWHALRNLILEMKFNNISPGIIQDILQEYYPLAKQNANSVWFRSYFFIARIIGYQFTNRIFYRIEKLFGFSKMPGYKKSLHKLIK